ncbi:hypothetical protein ACFL0Q_04820 [Thermodesulfobacteriota bacterium]
MADRHEGALIINVPGGNESREIFRDDDDRVRVWEVSGQLAHRSQLEAFADVLNPS